ncbi:MAG: DUF2807 domain-containing protein [Bacteroidetes bacterium]|nr:DUF2807 domain-containing protein [Bacteroidota bacterium]
MKSIINVMLVLLLSMSASGCNATEDGVLWLGDAVGGSGTAGSDVRGLPPITGVRLATVGVLTIQLGDKSELLIEADDNLIKHFVTKVDDGILTIKTEDGISMRLRSGVKFTLTVPSLSSVRSSSSGDIIAPVLTAERFEAECSSSGDIRIKGIKAARIELSASSSGDFLVGGVKADAVEVSLSSSGDCRIRDGKAKRLEASLSSSGDFDASDVEVGEATVRCSSSGDARVWVTGRLRASSSSSGDVLYRGDPKVEARESSSGDVRKL